jgi:hypothetical protein
MAFGQITIGTVVLEPTDNTSSFQFQPNTIYSGLEPGRSTYGTAQDVAPATTNTVKRLWVFSGVLVPAADVQTLRGYLTGTTRSYSLKDELWEQLLTGSSVTTNVRLIYNGDWLGKAVCDRANNTTQFEVSFAAWEI